MGASSSKSITEDEIFGSTDENKRKSNNKKKEKYKPSTPPTAQELTPEQQQKQPQQQQQQPQQQQQQPQQQQAPYVAPVAVPPPTATPTEASSSRAPATPTTPTTPATPATPATPTTPWVSRIDDNVQISDLKLLRKKLEALSKGGRVSADAFEATMRKLGYIEDMKENYLNTDFAAVKDWWEQVQREVSDSAPAVRPMNALASTSEYQPQAQGMLGGLLPTSSPAVVPMGESTQPVAQLGIIDDETGDVDEVDDIEDIERQQRMPQYKLKTKVHIKLIITNIATPPTLRKLLSPIVSTLKGSKTNFGMFHSALLIGPWMIEWNNSSLCIPRKCYSGAAVLAVDIPDGLLHHGKVDLNTAISRVAEVAVEWNRTKTYSQFTCNCQHFIDEVCRAIGIKLSFTGAVDKYLTTLRKRGVCDIKFQIPVHMQERLQLKEREVVFNTHAELDTFVTEIKSKLSEEDESFAEEIMLLKSFDRAFWLRHYKHEDDPVCMPLGYDESLMTCDCPFGDPSTTNSIKRDWW